MDDQRLKIDLKNVNANGHHGAPGRHLILCATRDISDEDQNVF